MSASARAQAHAKHAYFCSCGFVVHGNGAKAAHERMHKRHGHGHTWWTRTTWERRGRPHVNHPDETRRGIPPHDHPDGTGYTCCWCGSPCGPIRSAS